MKKRLLAWTCALVLVLGLSPAAAALEGESLRAADTLTTLGILRGAYDLTAPASRAQAVSVLVRLAGAEGAAAEGETPFQDVTGETAREAGYAAGRGWVGGSGGAFRPDAAVTANAWAAMLLRMLGYSESSGDFAVADAAVTAQRIGLFARSYSGELTQGDLFRSAVEALAFPYRQGDDTVIGRLAARDPARRAAANALGLLDGTLTARQAADRLMPAVFRLETYAEEEEIRKKEPSSNSSGFFITGDGVAVTCYHCIQGAIYGEATLSTGEVFQVERVLYYDADVDLAVLRIARTSKEGKAVSAFKCLELADSGDVVPGDGVYALGNPLGLGLAVSAGIVSAVGRVVDAYSLPCIMNTADISQGSSGGALVDVCGRAVGVTSGAYARGNNMYLAVPAGPILKADLTGQGMTLAEVARQHEAGIRSSEA